LGFCKSNAAHMKIFCKKTCGFCNPSPSDAPTSPPSSVPSTISSAATDGPPATPGPTDGPTHPPKPIVCGQPAISMQRVIAGTTSVPGSWPWQILLMGGRPGCGGSIIGPSHVITAAHCVFQYDTYPSFFSVKVGEHDQRKISGHEKTYKVKRVFTHPKWSSRMLDYDIALLELQTPIQFNKYVSPVCLPSDNPPVGAECYITGWGKTYHPGMMHPTLQQAKMPIVSNKVCYAKNKKFIPVPITSRMVCSGDGGHSRRSGCHGDSGGPFVCNINGRWELHGAVSHGSPRCKSTETYTVFARVYYFKQWIQTNMKN